MKRQPRTTLSIISFKNLIKHRQFFVRKLAAFSMAAENFVVPRRNKFSFKKQMFGRVALAKLKLEETASTV